MQLRVCCEVIRVLHEDGIHVSMAGYATERAKAPAFAVVRTGYLPRAHHCLPPASVPTFPLCSETRALGRRCQGAVESECGQEQIQTQKLGTADQFVIQRATETGASCKCITVVLYLKTEPTQIHRKPYKRDRIPLLTWQLPVSTADPPTHLSCVFNTKSVALHNHSDMNLQMNFGGWTGERQWT